MGQGTLIDEDFPARIEVFFPDRDAAVEAANALSVQFKFDKEQLSIVSEDQSSTKVHRNRFAFKASGRRMQKRQLAATLIAFAIVGIGFWLLHIFGVGSQPSGLIVTMLSVLIIAAIAITVIGMLSWRPAHVETSHRLRHGETALVVHTHDISEQYALHDALIKMGARVANEKSSSVS